MSSVHGPESRHRSCWYGCHAIELPVDIGLHSIEDGQLLPRSSMWFPVVGYQFDVRGYDGMQFFRPNRACVVVEGSAESRRRAPLAVL